MSDVWPDGWLTPSHFVMVGLLVGFAIAHSGLAALRPKGEALIGPRLYRVLFALVSIPFATVLIIYFINHRYDGARLWNLHGVAGIEPLIWVLSAISFLFLYPATFNLLEIAAIQKPAVHLYETGIIRITRHPQMVGQVIWCVAHTLWLGTSFMVVTSLGLIAHHLFAVWHGDRRMLARYGDSFETLKSRTSVIPFLAILQKRQTLELKEFIRPAYLGVTVFVLFFWWVHPILIRATGSVGW
ncbi:MAG TPA: NnrU family protein [Chroococcidiopsis sp.]